MCERPFWLLLPAAQHKKRNKRDVATADAAQLVWLHISCSVRSGIDVLSVCAAHKRRACAGRVRTPLLLLVYTYLSLPLSGSTGCQSWCVESQCSSDFFRCRATPLYQYHRCFCQGVTIEHHRCVTEEPWECEQAQDSLHLSITIPAQRGTESGVT